MDTETKGQQQWLRIKILHHELPRRGLAGCVDAVTLSEKGQQPQYRSNSDSRIQSLDGSKTIHHFVSFVSRKAICASAQVFVFFFS